MASNIVFNGVTYSIPVVADDGWGPDLTAYLIAISTGVVQKTGGNFTLTGELNFGPAFGIKAAYVKSSAVNPGGVGIFRLGNAESIAWRNAANTSDITLQADASGNLVYSGADIYAGGLPIQKAITTSNTSTVSLNLDITNNLTALINSGSIANVHIDAAAGVVYSKLNLTNSIVNADIAALAAITYSKLSLSSSIVDSDVAALAAISYTKLNLAGAIVNADINSSAAIAYSKLNLSGSILDADVNAGAAITYTKLSLSNSIVNADVKTSAAIAYSKLNLSSSIVNADVSASAAIALTKLAAVTASKALVSDGSGVITPSTVTATELGYLSGVTSSVQTQLNGKSGVGAVQSKTAAYTALTSDSYINCNATSAAFTITLYTAVGNAGKTLTITKTDSTFNSVTVDGSGSQTINGALTAALCTQFESITIFSDGANWFILERRIPSVWTSYTPTTNGLGTITSLDCYWRRIGANCEIVSNFTVGTSTAVEPQVGLPSGLSTAASRFAITAYQACGASSPFSAATTNQYIPLSSKNATYFSIGIQNGSLSGLSPLAAANAYFGSGNRMSFNVSIPITGWEG